MKKNNNRHKHRPKQKGRPGAVPQQTEGGSASDAGKQEKRAAMSSATNTATSVAPESEEAKRRRRMRSIAIALALGFLVVAFYAATIIRLGGNVMNRPL